MLAECECLDTELILQACLAMNVTEARDNARYLLEPLDVKREPNSVGSFNKHHEPPLEQFDVLRFGEVVIVLVVLQADVIRGIGEDGMPLVSLSGDLDLIHDLKAVSMRELVAESHKIPLFSVWV
jgi:hypothetical protein